MNGRWWPDDRRSLLAGISAAGGRWLAVGFASLQVAARCQSGVPGEAVAQVPGVVIDHSPASTRQYIGSPSIAILTNGDYLASHDLFGPGSTRDRTVVFRSQDRGKSWSKLAELQGQWWSALFVHRDKVYLMGTSSESGLISIRCSSDGGGQWTNPTNGSSGVLSPGGKFHCAPVPVVVYRRRIWRAIEDEAGPGGWPTHFRAFMMSAPENSDLLKASSWTRSNPLGGDAAWLDGHFVGWLEGNAVVTRKGEMVDMLRVHSPDAEEKAAIVNISSNGKSASFDPKSGFIEFPGGCKKFTVRFDPVSNAYWSLANYVPPEHRQPHPDRVRNTLALIRSSNLRDWTVERIVLYHPDSFRHGFHYVDWVFDGDDLAAVARTAFDDTEGGAHSQHDANYLTFHRVAAFRAKSEPE